MDRLLDTLAFVRKRRFTLDGLVALLVRVGGLWYLFAKVVGPHLLHIVKAVGWSAPDDVAHACFLAGFFGVMLLAFWLWRRYRSVPKFGKGELGIIFAPDFGEDIRDDVDRLFVHLKQEIKSSELGNAFGLKRLPPNLSISCPSEATAMLGESRGAVAVWGPLEQQSDAQGRTTGFSKIHLTFVVRAPRIPKRQLESMAMSFLGRQFHVRDRTLIADRKIMARDIGLVVRNVLGVAVGPRS